MASEDHLLNYCILILFSTVTYLISFHFKPLWHYWSTALTYRISLTSVYDFRPLGFLSSDIETSWLKCKHKNRIKGLGVLLQLRKSTSIHILSGYRTVAVNRILLPQLLGICQLSIRLMPNWFIDYNSQELLNNIQLNWDWWDCINPRKREW